MIGCEMGRLWFGEKREKNQKQKKGKKKHLCRFDRAALIVARALRVLYTSSLCGVRQLFPIAEVGQKPNEEESSVLRRVQYSFSATSWILKWAMQPERRPLKRKKS